jgi:tol-pal system-associated acyl-CoA thioesterase
LLSAPVAGIVFDVSDAPHLFEVQIYYEDTDFSGFVYHANYLRYFERAREHVLGPEELLRMWRDEGKGFAVYTASLAFKSGAVFGDIVEIRSVARLESEYRVRFEQQAVRKVDGKLLVDASIEMVCLDGARRPVPIPDSARPQRLNGA